jgi:hypothetical protein
MSCAPNLKQRVIEFQKAHNKLDVKKELSLSCDDAKQEESGAYKWIMQEAILNSRIFLTDIKVNGDIVTCKGKQQDDWFKTAGIDTVYYESFQLTFKDGLIKDIESTYTQESADAILEFKKAFYKWVSEKLGKDSLELITKGITIENVDKWLALVREWREETEKEK